MVVPSLLSLSDRGYGVDKGVPTLVIAAASVDDVLAITGFGVLMGIAFSEGNDSCCHEPRREKPVFGVSDQVRHKLGCTTTEGG